MAVHHAHLTVHLMVALRFAKDGIRVRLRSCFVSAQPESNDHAAMRITNGQPNILAVSFLLTNESSLHPRSRWWRLFVGEK